jgi:hypothetical protein
LTLRDKLVTLGVCLYFAPFFYVFVCLSGGVLVIPLFVLAVLFAIDVLLHLCGWRHEPQDAPPGE